MEVRDQLDAVLATTRRLKFGSDGEGSGCTAVQRIRREVMSRKGRKGKGMGSTRSRESKLEAVDVWKGL